MRLAFVVMLLLGSVPAHAGRWVLPDEDDPKLARAEVHRRWWQPDHAVPRFKLAYRRLVAAGLTGGSTPFEVAELDFYPVSSLVRFGLAGELGWAGGDYGLWYFTTGVTLGVQYPARVTPFLEGRFVAGLIGGSFQGQAALSWIYQGGIETGIELYYWRRFYLSAAIGWAHPVYNGIDVAALNRSQQVIQKDFSADSFTFKVGLGL